MTTARRLHMTAAATTAAGLIATMAAVAVDQPGLALLGGAAPCFATTALMRVRPRRSHPNALTAPLHAHVAWRMETRRGINCLVATEDGSCTRWTARSAA